MDDTAALWMDKNTEVPEMTKKVMKNLRVEGGKRGYGDRKGKSQMIASCGYWEEKYLIFCRQC